MTINEDRGITVLSADFERAANPDRFRGIPVANIGDAMSRIGMCDSGIRAMWLGSEAVGVAFPITVREGDDAGVLEAMQYMRAGDFVVINGRGDMNRALAGDRFSMAALDLGVTGLVVDGCVRDVAGIQALAFPVWARGVSPAGPTKNGPAVIGAPAAIGGVVACPGDIVVADGDGVIVIPRGSAQEIFERTQEVLLVEQQAKNSFRYPDA